MNREPRTVHPRVSIGLPVFNGERFLAEALDDLLGQTFGDLEIVACDNASTDATAEILADYARQDPRLVVVRNATNVGALANANLATRRARAPLFALAAYDDRHAPDFVARLVAALDADAGAVVAYGRQTLIGDDGRPFRFHPLARAWSDAGGNRYAYDGALERRLPASPLDRFRAVLRSNDVNAPIHGLFRREALDRIGGHRVHGSDRLIVAHAALLGRLAFVDAPLFGFRIHGASTFFLSREAWLAREAGCADAGSPLDGARTLAAYLGATRRTGLGPADRLHAAAAVLGYAVRPDALRHALLPGPDNYWGWTRWPWAPAAPAPRPLPPANPAAALGDWAWLDRETKPAPMPRLHSAGASDHTGTGTVPRCAIVDESLHHPTPTHDGQKTKEHGV